MYREYEGINVIGKKIRNVFCIIRCLMFFNVIRLKFTLL